jgi:hypothetical protein
MNKLCYLLVRVHVGTLPVPPPRMCSPSLGSRSNNVDVYSTMVPHSFMSLHSPLLPLFSFFLFSHFLDNL